jgi:beta-carotene hydroxylase
MTAHVVHHLHPRIPMDRTPAAFKEMLPVLRARQVDVAGR